MDPRSVTAAWSVVVLMVACAPGADVAPSAATASAQGAEAPDRSTTLRPSPRPAPTSATPSPVGTPSPSPPSAPGAERGVVDTGRAMEIVEALSRGIGPRAAGTTADRQARALVASALRAAGWAVEEEPFDLPQGGTSANLVATPPALPDAASGPHVVVGAHLDTVPGSPGANDNASGIGVLVAAAEELADEVHRLPVAVVLVAFGAEEYQGGTGVHHVGSEAYAERRAERVAGMLGVDMVGDGPVTCVCWFDAGPGAMAERLRAVADAAGIDAVAVERRGDISDHGPFARRGVPAAFLWTYLVEGYHGPGDTADRIEPDALGRAGELVLALVRSLGPGDRRGVAPAPSG